MKLLRELTESVSYLFEEKDGVKQLFLAGKFLQSAIPNRNKRIYPESTLTNETNRYIADNVQKKTAWGELNRNSGPNINLDRVCLRTVELVKEGTDFVGKAIVTPTPMGDIVRGLQASGGRLGVSSRALGSLKPWKENKDVNEVQDDLRILAIDCVGDPSAPDAWVDGIMEDIEYFYVPKTGKFAEQAKIKIKKLTKKQLVDESTKLHMFQNFLNEVSQEIDESMFRPKFHGDAWSAAGREDDGQKYKVIRFHKEGGHKTIKAGLTLGAARSHCNHPETSSATCKEQPGREYTKRHGHWFDGYDIDKR